MNTRPFHLLVIDDSPELCEILGVFLSRKGYQVSTAKEAREAEQLLMDRVIDLVLLDLKLEDEDGNGWDLLSRIHAAHPCLPVLIFTGEDCEEPQFQQAKRLGARGIISKAVPLGEMLMGLRHELPV